MAKLVATQIHNLAGQKLIYLLPSANPRRMINNPKDEIAQTCTAGTHRQLC